MFFIFNIYEIYSTKESEGWNYIRAKLLLFKQALIVGIQFLMGLYLIFIHL